MFNLNCEWIEQSFMSSFYAFIVWYVGLLYKSISPMNWQEGANDRFVSCQTWFYIIVYVMMLYSYWCFQWLETFPVFIDRVFCPKICLFKTDGWHFGWDRLIGVKIGIKYIYLIKMSVLTMGGHNMTQHTPFHILLFF